MCFGLQVYGWEVGAVEDWRCLRRPERITFFVGCNFCQLFIPHCNSTIAALIKPATAHNCIWCKMLLDLLTLLTMTVAILLLNNHNDIFC